MSGRKKYWLGSYEKMRSSSWCHPGRNAADSKYLMYQLKDSSFR